MRLVTDLDENGNKSAPDPIGTLRTPYSNANWPHFDPDHTRLQSPSKPAIVGALYKLGRTCSSEYKIITKISNELNMETLS